MVSRLTQSAQYLAVIAHGWAVDPQNEAKWSEFRRVFEEKTGIKSQFLLLPGLSAPLDKTWNLDNYVSWVYQQLPKNKKILFIGHSFGGQIGVRLAVLHPEAIERLVLIDSSGIRNMSTLAQIKRGVFFAAAKIGKVVTRNRFIRKALYKVARAQDYHDAPKHLRATMHAVVSQEVRQDLPSVKIPVCLVWGAADTVTPLWMASYFESHLQQAQLFIIDQARHSPQFTHPSQVVESIVEWLKEL